MKETDVALSLVALVSAFPTWLGENRLQGAFGWLAQVTFIRFVLVAGQNRLRGTFGQLAQVPPLHWSHPTTNCRKYIAAISRIFILHLHSS